ncbi:MAG: preprotein translocase subunit Sec61beta [Nanoarchaeota archaeon]|nr:preprotein translocase subunit Sec61beta [Nanoarchaeota archaeon]
MADNSVMMPSSGAGIQRFNEESSKIHISPYVVIGAIIVVMLLWIFLQF